MTLTKHKIIIPLTDFAKGLEIIEPFLKRYGFEFENYEEGENSGGTFVYVAYKNLRKKFIIRYKSSIRQVIYQHDNLFISHDFYLDQLGFLDKKELLSFEPSSSISAFKHILDDFEFLVEDFFNGKCTKLKEFSKLQKNIELVYNEKLRKKYDTKFDNLRIAKARKEFTMKEFKNCLETYETVKHKNLYLSLDNRVIEYCELQLLTK